jgi:hypothetical protein
MVHVGGMNTGRFVIGPVNTSHLRSFLDNFDARKTETLFSWSRERTRSLNGACELLLFDSDPYCEEKHNFCCFASGLLFPSFALVCSMLTMRA